MTNRFAIVDEATGAVLRFETPTSGRPPEGLEAGARAVMMGTPVSHWPAEPYAGAVLVIEGDALAWRDTRPLAEARAAKWEQVKAARDAAEWAGFTWDGSTFDSDALSQQRVQGAVQLALLTAQAGQQFSIDWTLADNSVRTLDGPSMVAVGIALARHVEAQFAIGRTLRAAIEAAAEDRAALGRIAWPASHS